MLLGRGCVLAKYQCPSPSSSGAEFVYMTPRRCSCFRHQGYRARLPRLLLCHIHARVWRMSLSMSNHVLSVNSKVIVSRRMPGTANFLNLFHLFVERLAFHSIGQCCQTSATTAALHSGSPKVSMRLVMPVGIGPGSLMSGKANRKIIARISGGRVKSRQTGRWVSSASCAAACCSEVVSGASSPWVERVSSCAAVASDSVASPT